MSTSVDNRVVNMQFNNKQFEAGVKETIASLDELQKSLNLNTSVTGLSTLQNAFNGFSLRNMEKGLESLTKRFSTMGIVGMTVIQNLTNEVTNFVKSKVTTAYNQILTGGWGRASAIAQARFTLQGLFSEEVDGAKKVEDAMKAAKESVTDTAYTMASAASVASQLAASNVTSYDDLLKVLTAVAGVAAQTGDSYDNVGHIFTTIAGNGRLMGMQLTQLSMHGLNAAAIIAKSMNTTEEAVREMVGKGEISFQQFVDAMYNAFGKHAKDANKTFSGTMDNIKAQLSKIGEIFSTGIIENDSVIEFLNDFRKALGKIKDAIAPLGEPFAKLMSSMSKLGSNVISLFETTGLDKFIELIGAGMEKLTGWIDTFIELTEAFKDNPVVKTIEDVAEGVDKITQVTQAQADIAKQIWNGPNLWGNGDTRIQKLGDDYEAVQAYLNEYIESLYTGREMTIKVGDETVKSMGEAGSAVEEVGDTAITASDAFNPLRIILEAIKTFGDGIHSVFSTVKNIAKSIGDSFKKVFSIFDIAGDIAFFGTTFSKLAGYFEITDERADKLTRAFSGLWSAIDIVKRIFKGVVTFIVDTFGPVFSTLLDIILTVAAAIGDFITGIDNWEKETGILSSVFQILTTVISNVIGIVTEFFKKLMQLPAVQKIKDGIVDLAKAIGDKLGPYLKLALDWVTQFFDKMNSGDGSFMDSLLDKINSALEFMISLFKKVKDLAVDFYEWIFGGKKAAEGAGGALGTFSDGVGKVNDTAEKLTKKDTFTNFFKKVGGGFKYITDGIKGFISKVVEFFKTFDYTKVVAVGLAAAVGGISASISRVMWNMGGLIKDITGIGGAIKGLVGQASGLIGDIRKKRKTDQMVKVIKAFALIIGVLTISLIALTKVDPKKLQIVAVVLGSLLSLFMAFITVMAILANKASTLEKTTTMVRDAALLVIAIGGAIYFLTGAIEKLSEIEWTWGKAVSVIVSLTVTIGLLVAACIVLSKYAPQMSKGGFGLILFAGSIYLIILSLKLLVALNLKDVADRIWVLIGIMGVLSIFIACAGQLKWHSALSVIGIVLSLYLLEMALWAIAYLGVSWDVLKEHFSNYLIVVVALGLIVTALGVLAKLDQSGSLKYAGKAIKQVAVALLLLAIIVKIIGKMDFGSALQGVAAVYALLYGIVFAMVILKNNALDQSQISDLSKMIFKLAIAIAMLSVVVAVLGLLPFKVLGKGLLVVLGIGAILGGLLFISKFANSIDHKSILAMVAVIATLAAVIIVMSIFVEKDLPSVLAAMGIIGLSLIAFAASFALASKEADKIDFKCLIVMVIMVLALAGSIIALAQFNMQAIAVATLCMIGIMLSMAEAFKIFMSSFNTSGGVVTDTRARQAMLIEMIVGVVAIALAMRSLVKAVGGNWNGMLISALSIIAIVGLVGLLLKELNQTHNIANDPKASGLIQMALFIGGVIGIILALSDLMKQSPDFKSLIAAAISIIAIVAVIVGIMTYLQGLSGKIDVSILFGLAIMVGAVIAIAYALKEALLTGADWTQMVAAAVAIGIILITISAAMAILAKVTSTGVGLLAFIVAVAGICITLMVLANTLPKLAKGILAVARALQAIKKVKIDFALIIKIAVILVAIVVACVALGVALAVLAVGLAVVGVALIVVGAGALLLAGAFWIAAEAIKIITTAGEKASKFLPTLSEGLREFGSAAKESFANIGKGLAMAIIGFAQVIVDNKDTVFKAIDTVIQIIAKCITSGLQLIVEIIVQKLKILLDAIGELAEPFIGAIAKIFEALDKHAHEFGYYGARIMGGFFGGIIDAIDENKDSIIEKATKLVLAVGEIAWKVLKNVAVKLFKLVGDLGAQGILYTADIIGEGIADAAGASFGGTTLDAEAEELDKRYNELLEQRKKFTEGSMEYNYLTKLLVQMQEQQFNLNRESMSTLDKAKEFESKAGYDEIEEDTKEIVDSVKATLDDGTDVDLSDNGDKTAESYFKSMSSKADEFSLENLTDKWFGSGDADKMAEDEAEELMEKFTKTVTKTMSTSNMPEDAVRGFLLQGWHLDETGKILEKEVQEQMDGVEVATAGLVNVTQLYDTMGKVAEDMKGLGIEAGKDYLKGVKEGLLDATVGSTLDATAKIQGKKIDDAFREGLEEHSPSRKGKRSGMDYLLGVDEGLIALTDLPVSTAATVADNLVNTFGATLDSIYTNIDSMGNPVISPVLDTTGITQANTQLNGYLGLGNLSAQANLTFQNTSQAALATQVQMLSEQVGKLAEKDYSTMFDGVSFNIDASTNVDGAPLKSMASKYTIEQIDDTQRGLVMAGGGRI